MYRLAKEFGKLCEFLKVGIGGCGPHEGDRVFIVSLNAAIDVGGQRFNAFERPMTYNPLGNDAKPANHLVEPRRIGRCEMDMKTWASCKAGTHLVMFVSGVIVHHQMNVRTKDKNS